MCTVAEICSTGVRVTLSDVPEVLLTATNSEPPVQDAGLAAKAVRAKHTKIGPLVEETAVIPIFLVLEAAQRENDLSKLTDSIQVLEIH